MNGTQIVPSPKNDFNKIDTLYSYVQVTGLDKSIIENSSLHYSISSLKKKKSVLTKTLPLTPSDINGDELSYTLDTGQETH